MRAARGDAGDGADGCGGAAESRGHRRRFYSSQPELSDKFVRAKELRLLSKYFPPTLPPAMASGGRGEKRAAPQPPINEMRETLRGFS